MGHPLIAEFCRAHELRQEFFRRCQRVFRDEVQPQLDERERLLVENEELKAQLEQARTVQIELDGKKLAEAVLPKPKAKGAA